MPRPLISLSATNKGGCPIPFDSLAGSVTQGRLFRVLCERVGGRVQIQIQSQEVHVRSSHSFKARKDGAASVCGAHKNQRWSDPAEKRGASSPFRKSRGCSSLNEGGPAGKCSVFEVVNASNVEVFLNPLSRFVEQFCVFLRSVQSLTQFVVPLLKRGHGIAEVQRNQLGVRR